MPQTVSEIKCAVNWMSNLLRRLKGAHPRRNARVSPKHTHRYRYEYRYRYICIDTDTVAGERQLKRHWKQSKIVQSRKASKNCLVCRLPDTLDWEILLWCVVHYRYFFHKLKPMFFDKFYFKLKIRPKYRYRFQASTLFWRATAIDWVHWSLCWPPNGFASSAFPNPGNHTSSQLQFQCHGMQININ